MAALAVNIGATTTRVGYLAEEKLVKTDEFPTVDYFSTTEKIGNIRWGLSDQIKLDAFGVCVAGRVEENVIIAAGNLPSWVGKSLRTDLSRLSGLSTTVLNDCQAEGLAAAGRYDGAENEVTYVGLGTGVGVAEVTRNPKTGKWHSRATERGHDTLDINSTLDCECDPEDRPSLGHAERLLGGTWLPERFGLNKAEPNFAHVTEEQWNDYLRHLAVFIRNLSTRGVRTCALGGGVTEKQIISRLEQLQELVERLGGTTKYPEVFFAGEDLGLYGAAFAALQNHGSTI